MSERVSGEEMLQLKAYLAEYSRLGDEINTRLEKEGTIIQVFLGFIVGIFALFMYLDIPNRITFIAFLFPPIEGLFLWFYSAQHIKLKKCCTHAGWISKRVNDALGKEVLTWDHYGVMQKLGTQNKVAVGLSKIVTTEAFFAMIVIPTVILVIFQMAEFSTIPGLDFLSFESGLFIGGIYILFLIMNLIVVFLVYRKEIWLYQEEKEKDQERHQDMNPNNIAAEEKKGEITWKIKQIEYRELCAYHRHQREATWQMGSILITASLAAFGIVASRFDVLPLSVLISSGLVSTSTLFLFWLIFERTSFLNDVVKARMEEIEYKYDMYVVRTYMKENEYWKKTDHPIGRKVNMRWLIRGLVVVYIVGWIVLWVSKEGIS